MLALAIALFAAVTEASMASLRDQAETIVENTAGGATTGGLDDLRGDYKRKLDTERKGLNPLLKFGPAIASAVDGVSTVGAIQHGAKEMNPVLAPFAGNPAALIGTRTAEGLLIGLAADALAKHGHPTLGKIVSSINIAVPLGAAGWNVAQADRMKKAGQ